MAIYHLAAGDSDKARHLYQKSLSKEPSLTRTKEAIRDLEDLLTVLSSSPNAEEMHSYLKSELALRLRRDANS